MPTYEYVCEACGNEFEDFASMSAPPIKKCPKCKKNKVQRKISTGGGIIFKGGGFYETDYRNDAYNKAAAADKPSADKPAETKTDAVKSDSTKPAETKAVEAAPVVEKPAAKAEPTESKSASKSASKSKSKK